MTVRLFVDFPLQQKGQVILSDNPYHYLAHVMRANVGDEVLLFNGKDGEWSTEIEKITKKEIFLNVVKNTCLQSEEKMSDVWLCFAPVKKDKMDFIIQKATELGVNVLQPVITHRTVAGHINPDKMRLQATEAAEQCERLSVPKINETVSLDNLLGAWEKDRILYYLNERGQGDALKKAEKVAYLVGPEGGFDEQEIEKLAHFKNAVSIHLGRRILRAETACITALVLHNNLCGWK